MARYGQSFKDKAVARLLPPESAALEVVAREVGIGAATLQRWREQAEKPGGRGPETIRLLGVCVQKGGDLFGV